MENNGQSDIFTPPPPPYGQLFVFFVKVRFSLCIMIIYVLMIG